MTSLEHTHTGGKLVGFGNPEIPAMSLGDGKEMSTGEYFSTRTMGPHRPRDTAIDSLLREVALQSSGLRNFVSRSNFGAASCGDAFGELGTWAIFPPRAEFGDSVSLPNPDYVRLMNAMVRTDHMADVLQRYAVSLRLNNLQIAGAAHFEEYFIGLLSAVSDWRFAGSLSDWKEVMMMIGRVMDATKEVGFDQPHMDGEDEGPYTGWNAAHFAVCDFLRKCVPNKHFLPPHVFREHRADLLGAIRRLVEVASASPVLGNPCRTPWRVCDADSRSYVLAAQTLRAKAIGALVSFMLRDEAVLGKGEPAIPTEVKELFDGIVNRETQPSPMFQLGRCFRHLCLRDVDWARDLAGKIFPQAHQDRYLHLAAWTGFITGMPTHEVFFDTAVQDLLRQGISLRVEPDERYRTTFYDTPAVGLARYLARAYLRLDEFDFDHPLLASFRDKADSEQVAAFVETVGKGLGWDSARPSKRLRAKLHRFWEWALKSHDDPEVFREFGRWMDVQDEITPPSELVCLALRTLKKSSGELETHAHLSESVLAMARAAPARFFECIRLYLEGTDRHGHTQGDSVPFGDGWKAAAKLLQEDRSTRAKARRFFEKFEDLRASGRET